jgi:hypothetical protein
VGEAGALQVHVGHGHVAGVDRLRAAGAPGGALDGGGGGER